MVNIIYFLLLIIVFLFVISNLSAFHERQLREDLLTEQARVASLTNLLATERTASDKRMQQSVTNQRSSIKGQISESMAPLMYTFKYPCKDARFLGSPVDYIVFPGMSINKVEEVVFLEVKTGKGSLTSLQRQLRDVITQGKVRWEVMEIRDTQKAMEAKAMGEKLEEEDHKPCDT